MAQPETIKTQKAETKTAQAAKIFGQMANFSRALVIKRFQAELELTPKGASTYYQNCRKLAGLVVSRKTSH